MIFLLVFAFAGNETNATRSVEMINATPTLSSTTLESNATTVNVGEMVQLSVMGTYSDGSSNAVDENITYTVTPAENAEVNGSVLTAKKDGNVTVQATVGGVHSNSLNLTITWIVNGHVLPPEPDSAVNNATLLGIDVNNNGVRDDVERWIYETYDHPIERGIFMQSSRAYNSLLTTPLVKHQPNKDMRNTTSCQFYWEDNNDYIAKKYEYKYFSTDINTVQFNTVKRMVARRKYELSLSGGVYSIPSASKEKCEFDENGTLKAKHVSFPQSSGVSRSTSPLL